MSFQFPVNKDVDTAQEKILQAKSAQEIKDLLKQDNPMKPNYQEGLIRLVTEQIMKQIPPEEIERIEKIPQFKPDSKLVNSERTKEILNLSSKMDNNLLGDIVAGASLPHYGVGNQKIELGNDIQFSIANITLDYIKNVPNTVDKIFDDVLPNIKQDRIMDRQIETAKKAGYVQGVCECVAAIGDDHVLGKKLLTEMNVDIDMAKKFANPETFKLLEQGIFAQRQEQTLEQTQSFKR